MRWQLVGPVIIGIGMSLLMALAPNPVSFPSFYPEGMLSLPFTEDFPTASGRNSLVFWNVLRYPKRRENNKVGKQLLLFSMIWEGGEYGYRRSTYCLVCHTYF